MTSQKNWLYLLLLLVFSGCATPTSRIHDFANTQNFTQSVVRSSGYDHLVFTRNLSDARNVLHVYLEGDGSPWKYRVVTMPDPTPRDPLMLRLMAKDSSAAVYVGRPCYNGTFDAEGCDKSLWTSGRYSQTVVRSMTGVIRQLITNNVFTEVKLFGHSGGGALAMLIAERIPEVTHIVTMAGNLDIDAWTQHHSYSKLYTSMNPAKQAPLRKRVLQWHLVGGQDQIVPPAIVQGFIRQQPNALGISIRGYSHGCCWEQVWPEILKAIRSEAAGFLPGVRFKLPE